MIGTLRLLIALALAGGVALAGAQPVSAQEPASVRLAHLSPTTPPMDVYLAAFEGGEERLVLGDTGYGAVSAYVDVAPAAYVFSWRPAGAPAAEPAMITMSAVLEAGAAYTVAGLGQSDEVRSVLIRDDLTPPAEGEARVRFINADASAGPVNLNVVGGPVLVQDAAFATVTDYGSVPAGPLTLQVATAETPEGAEMEVDFPAGSVNTLLLLESDSPVGDLSSVVDAPGVSVISDTSVISTVQDAVGSPAMPSVGAVAAGAGGTATSSTTAMAATAPLIAAAAAAIGALSFAATRRRSCARSS